MKNVMELVGQRVVQFQPAESWVTPPVEALRRRPSHAPLLTWPICWDLLPEAKERPASFRPNGTGF